MRYWITTLVILFAMTVAWIPRVEALEISGSIELSTVRMAAINQRIQLYADDHHESISGLHSAVSLSLGTTLGVSIFGTEPYVHGDALFASSQSGGGPIRTTALGLAAGGRYTIGPWSMMADLGVYRGSFSFVRGGYNGLSGWGIGINGAIDYAFRVTKRVSVTISLTLRWLTIGKMSDRLGTPYVNRGGPFFDSSGVGVRVNFGWIAW